MRRKLLPLYDEREATVEMIVIHSTASDVAETANLFAQNRVSSHYVVGEDGELWQLIAEKNRAWHAGISKWRGMDDINSRSVGIELCSPSLGQKPFTEAQQQTLVPLLKRLIKKYKIKPWNIVGHSDIAPTRKPDPGKAFFWHELADEGIGLWFDLQDATKRTEAHPQKLLEIIGYDTTDLSAAAYAFCRRFYPEKVAEAADVWALCENVGRADEALLKDEQFLQILRAVAYKYESESKTPCKI